MPETNETLAIRKKISAPAGPFDAPGLNLAKSMRLAFVRSFEEQIGLEVAVAGFAMEKMSLAQVAERVNDTDMIFMTQGPQAAMGLTLLDCDLVSGVLEQMITGRVVPGSASARNPTPTDAAVIASVLGCIFEKVEAGLAKVSKPPPIAGFRTSVVLADSRAVTLALEDIEYRSIHLTLDLASGTKTGTLRLVYPWSRATDTDRVAAGSWSKNWKRAIRRTNVGVQAVLLRAPMTLESVSKLQVGDMVPVPVQSVGAVAITGDDGRQVGQGRLGQANGFRAVRVTVPSQAMDGSQTWAPAEPRAVAQMPATADLTPAAPPETPVDAPIDGPLETAPVPANLGV